MFEILNFLLAMFLMLVTIFCVSLGIILFLKIVPDNKEIDADVVKKPRT